jgi:hypothetical protein
MIKMGQSLEGNFNEMSISRSENDQDGKEIGMQFERSECRWNEKRCSYPFSHQIIPVISG